MTDCCACFVVTTTIDCKSISGSSKPNSSAGRVYSREHNVTVWRLSVCLSRRHTHRDSLWGQHARRGQCTFRPDNNENPAYLLSGKHQRGSEDPSWVIQPRLDRWQHGRWDFTRIAAGPQLWRGPQVAEVTNGSLRFDMTATSLFFMP